MKAFFYLCAAIAVVLCGYLTFEINYKTRDTQKRVAKLQREIAMERETISVLNVEWAYLNRPERLRILSETYFMELRLMPIHAEHFADRSDVLTADLTSDATGITPVSARGQ